MDRLLPLLNCQSKLQPTIILPCIHQNQDSFLPSPEPSNHQIFLWNISQIQLVFLISFTLGPRHLLPGFPCYLPFWSTCQYCSSQSRSPYSCLNDVCKCNCNSSTPGWHPWVAPCATWEGTNFSARHHALLIWPCPAVQPHLFPFCCLVRKMPLSQVTQLFAVSQTLSDVPHLQLPLLGMPTPDPLQLPFLLAILSPSLETHTKQHGIKTSWSCEYCTLPAPGPKTWHNEQGKATGLWFPASLIQWSS